MLFKHDQFEAFVPASSREFIPVVIRHVEIQDSDEGNFLAFPVRKEDEQRW